MAKIASRIGLSDQASTFDKSTNMLDDVTSKVTKTTACIFVDEAQFLTKKQVAELCRVVDELGIPVLAYGLRTDFAGEAFEGSMYLLLWADELIEVKTICHCGRKATMNARLDSSRKIVRIGEQIDIGGNEKYISLCRKHHIEGNVGEIQ
jgi:thymidine kinase